MKETVKAKNIGLWSGVVLLTVVAFSLTYCFDFSSPLRVIIWITWFLAGVGLTSLTTQGKQVLRFAIEARSELLKIVWPTRQETIQKTTIVMAMVAATSLLLWGIDTSMMWVIAKITHLG